MQITVEIAARALGCSPQAVRIGLQRKIFPFGEAIKMKSHYTYIIPEVKLANYLEIPVEQLERYAEVK